MFRGSLEIVVSHPTDTSTKSKASIGSACMYYDEYACVTLDGAADERVVGFVLAIPEDHSKWLEKLREADDIEGYNAEDPEDNGLYQRAVVWATQDDTGAVVPAYVYHRTGTCKTSRRIWSGDWLDRSSQAQIKRNDKPPPVAPLLKAHTAVGAVGTVGTDRGGGRGGRGGGGPRGVGEALEGEGPPLAS
mmetsp:Transcript_4313/g.9012  ORF Transcript_4313/g.9012 Transcript_4313/m.9012 type:complete len:190 (+) Transcript_4313:979-1548(+)